MARVEPVVSRPDPGDRHSNSAVSRIEQLRPRGDVSSRSALRGSTPSIPAPDNLMRHIEELGQGHEHRVEEGATGVTRMHSLGAMLGDAEGVRAGLPVSDVPSHSGVHLRGDSGLIEMADLFGEAEESHDASSPVGGELVRIASDPPTALNLEELLAEERALWPEQMPVARGTRFVAYRLAGIVFAVGFGALLALMLAR